MDGVIVEGLVNSQSGGVVGPVAYISNKSKIVSLELNSANIVNAKNIFNRMVSTFKFTN